LVVEETSERLVMSGGEDRTTGPVSYDALERERRDAEILKLVAIGDDGALAELYQRHGHVVLGQILFVVGERALAEEILQDTMLAVWRQAGTFRGESRVRSWMIAIARRQARDRLRRNQLRVVGDTALASQPSSEAGPERVALDRADVADVARAIQSLGRSHREVLGLVFAADLTIPEVAEILAVPVGTVKSRLAAARSALCRALEDEGVKETSR
jgi:RNA polymerase sigma-70 factor (ECF subfamily)